MYLLQELAEGAEVDGVGVAEGAVDVEQDGFQRGQLLQGAAAPEFRFRQRAKRMAISIPRFSKRGRHEERIGKKPDPGGSGGSPVGRHVRRSRRARNAAALHFSSAEAAAAAAAAAASDADSARRGR